MATAADLRVGVGGQDIEREPPGLKLRCLCGQGGSGALSGHPVLGRTCSWGSLYRILTGKGSLGVFVL